MFNNEVYVSTEYKKEDYINLNLTLGSSQEEWKRGVEIYKDRIEGRYLQTMRGLINDVLRSTSNQQTKFMQYGFILMSIECLLIETLQQFKDGVNGNRGCSRINYIRFLTDTEPFSNSFDEDFANKFYVDIRCGILHSAQTKGNSQLTFFNSSVIEYTDIYHNSIRVDVQRLHEQIEDYNQNYMNLVLDPTKLSIRKNFLKKMNYICKR